MYLVQNERMDRFLICCLVFLFFTGIAYGQGVYVNYNRDYYHLLERYEIRKGALTPAFQTGFKPYRRDHVGSYLSELKADSLSYNQVDWFNLSYLSQDNWEFTVNEAPESNRKFIGSLYRTPSDFFYHRDEVFDIHINPVLYFHAGRESGESELRFRNTRGVEVRGSVDRKIGFYTYLSMTDLRFPTWVRNYAETYGAVPGEGFWKRYGITGYNYFSAVGYITFQATKHVEFQMGQDRNFVGEGYRSMILSDFSNPYVFLKINTKIWKLNLTNLWSQMNADVIYSGGVPTDARYPKKWFSFHRLSANLGKRLNVGIFESVMASEADWNYFSPLIFYRWVEHQLGTPDNVLMGTDMKWNLGKGVQLYGQFALNEFVFNEFFGIDGKQSSRNKYGLQAGIKSIDLLAIPNLDLQLEYNHARPYTYQEKFPHQSYSNYRTPLTHPLGANFREGVGILRYQPMPRFNLQSVLLYQYFGDDPDESSNFGGNVLKNRTQNNTTLFGNYIGQGVATTVTMASLHASYMLKHNLFVDLGYTLRNQKVTDKDWSERTQFLQASLRLNIARFDYQY